MNCLTLDFVLVCAILVSIASSGVTEMEIPSIVKYTAKRELSKD